MTSAFGATTRAQVAVIAALNTQITALADQLATHFEHAGTSPITRASGTKTVDLARFIRPARLADAIDQWAFCSLRSSPGSRAFYDRRRADGDSHHKALRALGNLVGILHGCLRHHTHYNEHTAWAHRSDLTIKQAA